MESKRLLSTVGRILTAPRLRRGLGRVVWAAVLLVAMPVGVGAVREPPAGRLEQEVDVVTVVDRINRWHLGTFSGYRFNRWISMGDVTRFNERIAEGDALQPQLIQAAVEAYEESPETQGDVAGFLVGLVYYRCGKDDYENALPLAKQLIEHQVKDKSIYTWAAVAAFALCELDLAEQYFQQAKQAGQLSAQGERYLGDLPYYKEVWPKEQEIRTAEAQADDLPHVLLKTSKGDIELELFENQAPNTVANFISLVEKKFYNGLTFHRVLPGFMAQSGSPTGDSMGSPGYRIPCECYPQDKFRLHFRGSLSMAKSQPRDTGGSQFFLTFLPTSHLDGQHTVFGRVIKGFDVLHKLQRRDPDSPPLPKPDKIIEAKVLRKREHDYVPKTLPE